MHPILVFVTPVTLQAEEVRRIEAAQQVVIEAKAQKALEMKLIREADAREQKQKWDAQASTESF